MDNMKSALSNLMNYGSDNDSDNLSEEETVDNANENQLLHLQPINNEYSVSKSLQLAVAPEITSFKELDTRRHIKDTDKELTFNPKYEELFAPKFGPEKPMSEYHQVKRNILSGHVEETHVNHFNFESQRLTFNSRGYAVDPSVSSNPENSNQIVGDVKAAEESSCATVFQSSIPRKKRKKNSNNDPQDIDGFQGPWAKFTDEKTEMKPSAEEQLELDEITAKRNKRTKKTDDQPIDEKSLLHIKDAYDYQGRSYLHIPQDVGVNLKSTDPPEQGCFLPKKLIHTWKGHSKGVSAIRWFPLSGHLLLSCSMDMKVKLWEVYNERRCIRSYIGHKQAVRDVCFNNDGKQFLSAGYDRYIKLWDTETGECISRYTSRKIPYCIKFHPDEDKQNLFVAGTSDKKIVCWDTRTGEAVQEYDRHLGAVNTITFIDENRRFVSTSDDKSLRVWEWDIPVDFKYIADPSMHSMPAVTLSPNKKWLACQSMDNKVVIFSALDRFKINRKKVFTGHMVAGYACMLDFSPDMKYIVSGDADGKAYCWNWKTTELLQKWKAHDDVCISALWHPHETSKVATAGWDGVIKYWD